MFQTLCTALLAVAFIASAEAGRPVSNDVTEFSNIPLPYPCTPSTVNQLVCQSCNAYAFCFGANQSSDIVYCPRTSPYCVTLPGGGTCKSMPDGTNPDCGVENERKPIVCNGEGIFPDPKNCEDYHYCAKDVQLSLLESCPTGYNFNATAVACSLASLQPCMKVDCDKQSSSVFQPYGDGNNRFYAFCDKYGSPPSIRMYTCPTTYKMNFEANSCEYQCIRVGVHPYYYSTSYYYECFIAADGKMQSRLIPCPPGKSFNPNFGKCL